jgi:hypothetical protein
MAVGTLLALSAGAKAAGGLVGGIGQAVAARQQFTGADRRDLEELEERKRRGELGLDESEREAIRGDIASQRGGLLRQQQADALTASARQGPTVSGRDIFLQQQQAAEATLGLEEAGLEIEAGADRAAADRAAAEIGALKAGRAARKAGMVSALTGGVATGLQVAGDVAATRAGMEFQTDLQAAQLEKELTQSERIAQFLGMQTQGKPSASVFGIRSGSK